MADEFQRYQFDGVEVNPAAFVVTRGGKNLALEPKGFRVLLYLIENRKRAVGKEELIEAVWEGTAVTDNALTRIVAQLRRELGDDAHQPRYIQTLPTVGYRFVAEVRSFTSAAGALAPPWRSRKLLFIAVGAVAVIIFALVWLLVRRGAVAQRPEIQAVQLTTSPGLDLSGSFSPDGNSFAYCSNRSGQFEVYVRALGSDGIPRQITSDGMQNIEPAWSPDGKSIAYHSVGRRGIWRTPVSGGAPERLTAFGSAPAWSPDGQQIAFRSAEPDSLAPFDRAGDSTIWLVAADGSQLRQITMPRNPPGEHVAPAWTPDGKRVAFASRGEPQTIWSVNPGDGNLQKLLTTGKLRAVDLAFAGSTGELYFTGMSSGLSDRFRDFAIYRAAASGQAPVLLHFTRTDAPLGLALSPNGKQLLYTRVSFVSQLWIGSVNGEGAKPIHADAVVRAHNPVFSPYGSRLVYLLQAAGRDSDLWMMNPDGAGAVPVATERGYKFWPVWSTDGTEILYTYSENATDDHVQIRRVNPDSKSSRVWFDSPSLSRSVARTHAMADGQAVLEERGVPTNIWLRPVSGSPPRQLTFEQPGATFPFASWDGQWIAYETKRGEAMQIGIVDRNGEHQEILTDDQAVNWPQSWASDNRRIACAGYRDGVWNLFWLDRVTRQRKQITRNTAWGSFVRSPAWRPGTEQVVYEYSQVRGNVYLLDVP